MWRTPHPPPNPPPPHTHICHICGGKSHGQFGTKSKVTVRLDDMFCYFLFTYACSPRACLFFIVRHKSESLLLRIPGILLSDWSVPRNLFVLWWCALHQFEEMTSLSKSDLLWLSGRKWHHFSKVTFSLWHTQTASVAGNDITCSQVTASFMTYSEYISDRKWHHFLKVTSFALWPTLNTSMAGNDITF